MKSIEKAAFLQLFNRDGYVLDFSTFDFDAFTMNSIGVALCHKYNLSKGKSLMQFINEASDSDCYKLLSDLLRYYESEYKFFKEETSDYVSIFGNQSNSGKYSHQYEKCKEIIEKYKNVDPNSIRAESIKEAFSSEYMSQQIKIMLETQTSFPADALAKAKDIVESCCRTILNERGIPYDKDWTFVKLVYTTFNVLKVTPEDIDESSPIANQLKQIFGSLKGVIAPIAEIRNAYGTGHGREASFEGLEPRHACLLVGASITVAQFLWMSHEAQECSDSKALF